MEIFDILKSSVLEAVYFIPYIAIICGLIYVFETNIEKYLFFYLISVFVITGLLIYICYKKGEPTKWRWGKK